MKSIDNLYSILNIENNSGFTIKIDGEHSIFKGHFPGSPVLPGVCTLYMVKESIKRIIGADVIITKIAQCKFTGMVNPFEDNILYFSINIKESQGGEYKVDATVSIDGKPVTILKLKCNVKISGINTHL